MNQNFDMDDICTLHKLTLKLYCEDCSYLICNKCNRQSHNGHDVVVPSTQLRNKKLIDKEIPNNKEELKKLLQSLKDATEQEAERSVKLREKIAKRQQELAKLTKQ